MSAKIKDSRVRESLPVPYASQRHHRRRAEEDAIIAQALGILENRLRREGGEALTTSKLAERYLSLRLADLEHEVFGALFMDVKHRVIEIREIFRGTIDGASIHSREVVKDALALNAAAVIFYHNHPSGTAEPSNADEQVTRRLKNAMELVEIRVLDHMIVGNTVYSFADHGRL